MTTSSDRTRLNKRDHREANSYGWVGLACGGRLYVPAGGYNHDDVYYLSVVDTGEIGDYITVQFKSGNADWYEFCFRIVDDTGFCTTLTRMEDGKDCSVGWVPSEVRTAIAQYHPDLDVSCANPFS